MGIEMLKEFKRVFPVVTVVTGSLFLASCSSSISRFDFPTFGLGSSDSAGSPSLGLNGSARLGQGGDSGYMQGGSSLNGFDESSGNPQGAVPSTNQRSSYMPPQTAAPEVRAARYTNVQRDELRPLQPQQPSAVEQQKMQPIRQASRSFLPNEPTNYDYAPPVIDRKAARPAPKMLRASRKPAVRLQRTARTQAAPRPVSPVGKDNVVTVAAGDTLYSIGRRHGVSVMKLMDINQLADSNIAQGQRLRLPANARRKSVHTQSANRTTSAIRTAKSGTYAVKAGESFQQVSQKLGVDAAELADINGITDPGSIRPGEVLIVPAKASRKKVTRQADRKLKVRQVKTKTIKLAALKQGNSMNDAGATVGKTTITRKKSPSKTSIAAFRWPVRGRIIAKFGSRGDGTHNDGINLAVPAGTKVKAAESGVVAYAGSELKGYGKLILIRHSNGWVSAYAHNSELIVKRGDHIKRGQVISRAGNTGSVDQPQVHFELRKGSKPVDPLKHMTGA